MAQGPELSEMQQRVEAAGSRFREVAEDRRQRRERLAGLLDQVESGVAQGRQEIDRLTRALADANDENAQLYDLLDSVLALAEQVEEPAEIMGLSEMEARMERLSVQAAVLSGADGVDKKKASATSHSQSAAGASRHDGGHGVTAVPT